VTLKNKGSERATFSVRIEAVNADGERIADDSAYAADLGPGQSVTEDLFTLVSDGEYDELTTATFKVISVTKY
jgi:hypothetical protein